VSLPAGTKLGSYEIAAPLGAGGMGEVYRARDSKLHRDVAIKVLLPAVVADPDRLARFSREAHLLASLNHPNIAQIHGLEEGEGVRALVMELVEGQDLAQRLARGPLPLDEALPIARQIAEALEAAHDHGIIHRDLKPANIKVRPDGTVKVLDFGLAKALDAEAGSREAGAGQVANSPTISMHATHAGVILGTAAYMSPEQARGRFVDRRTDIWAFGCVLFEMLTGARAFPGQDVTDIIVAVVSKDPDWQALPATVPSAIRRVLRRCLEKDPRRRLDSAAAVRIDLDEALSPPEESSERGRASSGPGTVAARRVDRRVLIAVGLLAAVAGAIAGAVVWPEVIGRGQSSVGVTRTLIGVAPAEILQADALDSTLGEGRPSRTAFALSPDGRSLVFSGAAGGRQQLFHRALDQLDATPIPGTEDGGSPFFSPDGQWVAFQAGGMLKKVPLAADAPPTTICRAAPLYGGSWGTSGTIVFAAERSGLWTVAASGGTPESLTSSDSAKGEYSHRLPHFLPDGDTVIFTVIGLFLPKWDEARLSMVRVSTRERRDLGPGADARYVSTGHLIFMRSGTLAAAAFDLSTRDVAGSSLMLLDDVMQAANMSNISVDTGAGQFALSHAGDLAYVPGGIYPDRQKTIVVSDRQGRIDVLPIPPRPFFAPLVSPDGTRLVVWTQGLDRNIWTYDLARGTLTRLTTEGRNHRGIWTPDGKRITYAGGVSGGYRLFTMPADGSGPPELLTDGATVPTPGSWSPDGQTLLYRDVVSGESGEESAIMAVSPAGNRQPRTILQSRFTLAYPEFSADGKWLAYVSNESGRDEVYVQPYPGPGPRQQVSTDGGTAPAWARNGRELFYTTPYTGRLRMMAVPIALSPFRAGSPRALFEGDFSLQNTTRGYDVSADGQRFFLTQMKERPPVRPDRIVLVQNWGEELKRRVPTP
jgi:serine/threonine-protein kinase